MEASFWHEKWEVGHIGFHMNKTNPLLIKYFEKLQLRKNARVFLPLCGKTLDIAYLIERGYYVIGIELSELAIKDLFEDLKLTPKISNSGNFTLYQAENIDIYIGDFFDLNTEVLGKIDAIYDRASLIALPLETRKKYSQHLANITQQSPQLVISLEYDQEISKGPPFSVTPNELKQHYSAEYNVNCIESNFSKNGLKGKYPVTESVWILTTK